MAGAPAVSPIPGADVYGQEATLANNAYNNALAQINKNRMNTLTQYGYTGQVDPNTGVMTGVGVDPHSMYGALQQQFHGDALQDRSLDDAAQSRGLVGGLAHQGHALAHYEHGAALTSLGEQLTGALDTLGGQQQSAGETRDAALWQAEQDQLASTLQSEQADTLDQLLNPAQGGADSSGVAGDGGSSGGGPGGSKAPDPRVPGATYRGLGDFPRQAKKRAVAKIINKPRRPGRQE